MRIRDITASDEIEWRVLWAKYCSFYNQAVPEAVTAATWRRIIDPASGMFGRGVESDGRLLGFANSVLHLNTWTTEPGCYLEDLFVDEAARGKGLGRALIDDLINLARARGWSRVYWHTQADNAAARRLYDSYVPADGFVRYRIAIERTS